MLAQSEYCGDGTVWDAYSQTCIVAENVELLDANLDGIIGVEDLMNLLSHFGDEDLDLDGIFDSVDLCNDPTACNYNAYPSEECLFFIDEVGVCGGACVLDENQDGICDLYGCGGTVNYHGYNYETVQIGDQCWFAENLQASFFANGDTIPLISTETPTQEPNPIYRCIYDDSSTYVDDYGYLYSWYAVNDVRNLCPSGWHIPLVEEFQLLFETVGGVNNAAFELKAAPPTWNGTDSFGYSALPGGYFNLSVPNSLFINTYGYLWTNSETGVNTAYYVLFREENDDAQLYPSNGNLAEDAMSVRCLKN